MLKELVEHKYAQIRLSQLCIYVLFWKLTGHEVVSSMLEYSKTFGDRHKHFASKMYSRRNYDIL